MGFTQKGLLPDSIKESTLLVWSGGVKTKLLSSKGGFRVICSVVKVTVFLRVPPRLPQGATVVSSLFQMVNSVLSTQSFCFWAPPGICIVRI